MSTSIASSEYCIKEIESLKKQIEDVNELNEKLQDRIKELEKHASHIVIETRNGKTWIRIEDNLFVRGTIDNDGRVV